MRQQSKWWRGAAPILLSAALLAACSGDDVETNNASAENNGANGASNNAANNIRQQPDIGAPNSSQPADMGEDTSDMEASGGADMGEERDLAVRPGEGCEPGEELGCAEDGSILVCDEAGEQFVPQACPGEQRCLPGQGCTDMVCVPGTLTCDSAEATKRCNADGTGYEEPVMCPPDQICSRNTCRTMCELGKYRSSYVGCEYWTLDLDQYSDPYTNPMPDEVEHAVVISNPNNKPATVSFRAMEVGVSINVPDPVVPAGSARSFTMPRLDVTGTGTTQKSIRVTSSIPVVAHQFNPLNNERVYSNDASLLLPVNTLGDEYYVVGWPTQVLPCFMGNCPDPQHSYVTIVATEMGDTYVNVTPTAQLAAGGGINPITPGVTRSFTLKYGEVLNLEARSDSLTGPNDLTGTYIKATQNVAVFAGHEEAVIGEPGSDEGSCCADHLEQQLFPTKDWGTNYIAALSPGRGQKKDHWRIVAGEDGVQVTTNPPQPGANNVTLNRGEFVKFFSDQSFEINATGKVMVGQFLVSQEQTSAGTGDPAFLLAVPTDKFREDYALLTPNGYSTDFVTVIRPAGVQVNINGMPIADMSFAPVGSGAYEVGAVAVQPGVQVLESTQPFGISAYGFNNAVSYGYPGGLNLVGEELETP